MSQRPLVIELAGPAGAGKSTLTQALLRRHETIRLAPSVRSRRHILFLLASILRLLPPFLWLYRTYRLFPWVETREIVLLDTLYRLIGRATTNKCKSLILDQGPVFSLAYLQAFGHGGIKGPYFQPWWETAFHQWARTLHVIIWLDAPDSTLAQRIRARDSPHRVKGCTDEEIYEFLARYRRAYAEIISTLTAHGGPKVFQFDTGRQSPDQLVDQILLTVDGECSACRLLALT